jgi:arylsulfatase A-like enzyme
MLAPAVAAAPRFPDILLLTVDTLRADRLSAYGYARPTSPHLDRLLASGVRFTRAHTPEPLTTPALVSLLTSRFPHEHGSTRNGLPARAGLPSIAKILGRRGYRTAAWVGNWTLRDPLSGLAEHFQTYEVLLTRRRWLGLLKSEAVGADLTEEALEWAREATEEAPRRPFFLWVHYVEPHAPYRMHDDLAGRLGLIAGEHLSRSDRYDTEVAYTDDQIGRLLAGLGALVPAEQLLVLFAADHGESLGEHGDWGHGRTLYEPALRVPMGFSWPGKVSPAVIAANASSMDLAPTILALLGLPPHPDWHGRAWSNGAAGPGASPRCAQAHKGAVQSIQDAERARRAGLLEVGWMDGDRKELVRTRAVEERALFDLASDSGETRNLVDPRSAPSAELAACLDTVRRGLVAADALPRAPVDPETLEGLRALGYID